MRYIGGIDPGLKGSFALLDFKLHKLHIWDTPTYTVKVGDRKRTRCDELAYREALDTFPCDLVMVEKVQSTPNDGHVGAFTFGKVTGIAIGLVVGLDYDLSEVNPAKWKMAMQCPANKEAARYRASELFPACSGMWVRQMDDGRAEGAMIALYAAITNDLISGEPFTPGLLNGIIFRDKRKEKQNG